MFYAILGALVGGMLLNLMPCVFPILALKALHPGESGRRRAQGETGCACLRRRRRGRDGALGGLLAGDPGRGRGGRLGLPAAGPRTTIVLLLLLVAITLNLLRVFELPVLAGEHNPSGSFGTGAMAAFVATPCAGPFLGAALGTALLLPLYGSIAVFAALGLGLAIPFTLIAFAPGLRKRLPQPGPWMVRLQCFLAIPMAATAVGCLWLLYRQAGANAFVIGLRWPRGAELTALPVGLGASARA